MSVTLADVENIARLAKLSFSKEEMITFTGQFNQILQYMEKLNELDTENVEPTFHVLDSGNPLRDDVQQTWLTPEQALANAPKAKNGFFSVPKMIG
ncbi:MAG TPA: Asp-tRNA(Asn)/Glu-tRNA(Gln) amidotransferase subunit GatC [bacterium]|nr:Asp-tRNA(Asn)/Glu-tRNA(Gln) amidotransferase subunit GatC [bacterium]HPN42364.1 Asp-tRNA(Asn)/Glu-tRNA(Gln) amidotransferase subunit GatC [bacterium]